MTSVGPIGAGTGGNSSDIGVTAWSTPSNITADDSSYATVGLNDGAGGCFIAGTQIKTPASSKAIELLEVGDIILDVDGLQCEVTQLFQFEYRPTVKIETSTRCVICTADHPFLSNGDYVQVAFLAVGDLLQTTEGPEEITAISESENATVFNIECSQHTFIANGFKVHNK